MFTASKHHTRLARAAGVALAVTIGAGPASRASAQGVTSDASLDSLLNVRVEAASRYEQEARWAPASLTIVTKDEIRSRGYTTLADVLQDVPGFYTTYDRDYSFIGVRGFSRPTDWNNRVLVLLNGHPLNEGLYFSVPTGAELVHNMRGLERIEIVRGPGSALYGTSAMFAVINLVRKDGAELDGASVAAEVGSLGARGLSVQAGQRFQNGLDLTIAAERGVADGQDLYFPEFDEPSTNDGVAVGLDWEEFERLTGVVSVGGLSLTARINTRDKGIPTGAWDTAFNDSRSWTRSRWAGVDLRHESRPSASTELALGASFDGYRFYGRYPYAEDDLLENRSDADQVRVSGQLNWDLAPAYRVTLGSEIARELKASYRSWSEQGTSSDGDYPYQIVSAFTQIEAQIAPRIALTAGLRHDDYTYAGSATTPRLALVATPDAGSVVKLLWGRAYRAPNIYEQFVTTTSNARPALSAETIETWELTAERRLFRNLHAQGSLYRYQVDDLIDLLYDPVDYSSWYQNQSRSRAAGGELGLLFRGGFVRANLSYGFSAAVNDETGERMNNSPRHLIKGLATVQIPAGFEATWAQRFESGRLTIQGLGSERFTHGTLTLRKPGLFKRGEAVLQIRNVFDASYATPGGFEHRLNTIPQDGRTFTLRLEWGF